MGAWGIGLYCDDTACDVRDDYIDILGDGISEPEATRRLVEMWEKELSDPDISPVFWLTLADVQWNLGRLQENVKKEALTVIENGSDIIRWVQDKKLEKKRKSILDRIRQKLNTAQPAEKKVKKRFVDSTDWNLGDVYSFRLKSGKLVFLHVIGFHQDHGGRRPVCEIFQWIGENVPGKEEIKKIEYKVGIEPYQHVTQFMLGSLSKKDFQKERVSLVAQNINPRQKRAGYVVVLWRSIDKQLEQFFGLQ